MILNDHFTLNSAFFSGMSRALKTDFRSLATFKLVVNVGEHQTERNGITWFPCDSTAFLLILLACSKLREITNRKVNARIMGAGKLGSIVRLAHTSMHCVSSNQLFAGPRPLALL